MTMNQLHLNSVHPLSFYLFLCSFQPLLFPSLLLFLTLTLSHGGCLNRWKSWSVLSESLVCWGQSPNPSQIRKYWRSLQYHEKEKHWKEDFLQPMDICQKCWRQGQSHFVTREVWWEWKLFVDYFEECKASNWDFVFKSLKTLTEEDPPEWNIYSKPLWKKKNSHFYNCREISVFIFQHVQIELKFECTGCSWIKSCFNLLAEDQQANWFFIFFWQEWKTTEPVAQPTSHGVTRNTRDSRWPGHKVSGVRFWLSSHRDSNQLRNNSRAAAGLLSQRLASQEG